MTKQKFFIYLFHSFSFYAQVFPQFFSFVFCAFSRSGFAFNCIRKNCRQSVVAVVESLSSHLVSFQWKFARKSTAVAVATLVNVIVFNATLRSAIPDLIAMRISRHSGQTGTLILIASHRCNSHTVRLQLGLGFGLSLFHLWESLSHLTSVCVWVPADAFTCFLYAIKSSPLPCNVISLVRLPRSSLLDK